MTTPSMTQSAALKVPTREQVAQAWQFLAPAAHTAGQCGMYDINGRPDEPHDKWICKHVAELFTQAAAALGLRLSADEPAQPLREAALAALVKAARTLLIEAGEGNSKGRAIDLLPRKTFEALQKALAAYDTPAKPDPLRQRDSVASAGREEAK